jgi:hypothetical protein
MFRFVILVMIMCSIYTLSSNFIDSTRWGIHKIDGTQITQKINLDINELHSTMTIVNEATYLKVFSKLFFIILVIGFYEI